jgi:DNA polymerase III alpha subunit (gram-positive type)
MTSSNDIQIAELKEKIKEMEQQIMKLNGELAKLLLSSGNISFINNDDDEYSHDENILAHHDIFTCDRLTKTTKTCGCFT